MVARGDLGLEMPLERVPRVQKDITRAAPHARHAGHRRHAGARVDDDRAAADARRGQRRGQRRRRRRGRDHAGGRDGGRRASRRAPCRRSTRSSATPSARRRRGAVAAARTCAGRGHAQALCEAAVTLANRGDAQAIVAVTRGGDDGAAAVGAPAARADHRRDRPRGHRAPAGALLGRRRRCAPRSATTWTRRRRSSAAQLVARGLVAGRAPRSCSSASART